MKRLSKFVWVLSLVEILVFSAITVSVALSPESDFNVAASILITGLLTVIGTWVTAGIGESLE